MNVVILAGGVLDSEDPLFPFILRMCSSFE